jgi:hypothetical protein
MRDKDDDELLKMAGYYATEAGKQEVLQGSHDEALREHDMSRAEWIETWEKKLGVLRNLSQPIA